MKDYLLAIDQGTTHSRAIIFNRVGQLVNLHEVNIKQFFPHPAWVEQSPNDFYDKTVECCREVLKKSGLMAKDIAAIGIANQRETTIIWDKATGEAIYPAIVWQDRRSSELCRQWTADPSYDDIPKKTGLRFDPYFSALKILWILDNVPQARYRAERGELLFGTVDTYLLWRLTGGKVHKTDVTNASRTLLFNIYTQTWDHTILAKLNIPAALLPTIEDNAASFGMLDHSILGDEIPIAAMIGDQQAAAVGQACFQRGMVKTTYGTGCFMLLNTGSDVLFHPPLLSTVLYRINQQMTYGIEGSIFSAGVVVKWLRDTLKIIKTSAETEQLASSLSDTDGVYLVPAFTGLGAPYWKPEARAALLGITTHTQAAHIVRAGLESVIYQTKDLLNSMQWNKENMKTMRVDGGMAANDWLLQFLADMLALPIERPQNIETTALGAAYLAGLQVGLYTSLDEIAMQWKMEKEFQPIMSAAQRSQLYQGWQRAVACVLQYG